MLYLALVFSAVLLAVAYRAARPAPEPVRWSRFVWCGLAVSFGPVCLGLFSRPAAFLFAALSVALLVWPLARRRVRSFLPLAAAAFFGAFGLATDYAFQRVAVNDALRERYAFESMADRVPEPAPADRIPASPQLAEFEKLVDDGSQWTHRSGELRQLHEETVSQFVNSFGFGVGRMGELFQPSEFWLRPPERDDPPAQPGPRPEWDPSAARPVSATAGLATHEMHAASVLDFANPAGFGYVRDRNRVAGFQPHGFSRIPKAADALAVRRVELVGLLKHPAPVVYVSDKLPAMGELRDAPTRPLDAFEAAGLAAARRGESLYAEQAGATVRAVGSVRSVRQCVGCHGGERGDLLGAFAYVLAAGRGGGAAAGPDR